MNKRALILLLMFLFMHFIAAQCNQGQIDINTASLGDLDKLTGIGPAKAQAIIDARPYSTVDELVNANGIGSATLEKIKQQGLACVSGASESQNEVREEENKEEEPEPIQNQDSEEEPENKITSYAVYSEELKTENSPNENIINLNSDNTNRKEAIVYESKNEIIRKYAIYVFAVFLVLIIIILLIKR